MKLNIFYGFSPIEDSNLKEIGDRAHSLFASFKGLLVVSPFQEEEGLPGKLGIIESDPPQGPGLFEDEGKGND